MDKEKKINLKQELEKIRDTGKSIIIKKYNLSLYDIRTVCGLFLGLYDTFIENNIFNLLKDAGYKIKNEGIGYRVVREK